MSVTDYVDYVVLYIYCTNPGFGCQILINFSCPLSFLWSCGRLNAGSTISAAARRRLTNKTMLFEWSSFTFHRSSMGFVLFMSIYLLAIVWYIASILKPYVFISSTFRPWQHWAIAPSLLPVHVCGTVYHLFSVTVKSLLEFRRLLKTHLFGWRSRRLVPYSRYRPLYK